MKDVIEQVMEETQQRIAKENAKRQEVIDHFCDPIPQMREDEEWFEWKARKALYFAEHIHGKYSTQAMEEAYEDIDDLQRQERELAELRYLLSRASGR